MWSRSSRGKRPRGEESWTDTLLVSWSGVVGMTRESSNAMANTVVGIYLFLKLCVVVLVGKFECCCLAIRVGLLSGSWNSYTYFRGTCNAPS